MSDNYLGNSISGIVNVTVTDGSDSGASRALSRAEKLLAGFEGGVKKAVNSALSRAGTTGRTSAAREVGKYYQLKIADFKKYTQSSQKIQQSGDEISVGINFRGTHIPLIRFNTRLGSNGRITTQVRRDSARKTLDHAFHATMDSGHVGIFERVYSSRLPIGEMLGPSAPQMMGANENLANAVGDTVRKTFEERMEHEILAIMNGWR